jgi:hypothetical protein
MIGPDIRPIYDQDMECRQCFGFGTVLDPDSGSLKRAKRNDFLIKKQIIGHEK